MPPKLNKRYKYIFRILDLIDTLPKSRTLEILDKISSKSITHLLQNVVVDLPENELVDFHEELKKITLGKRACPRKECILTTDYSYGDSQHCDFVKDISEQGAFIYTQAEFEIGDEIVHSYYFPDKQLQIEFTGEVVRSEESGIGIRFIKMSNYHKDIIKSILNDQ